MTKHGKSHPSGKLLYSGPARRPWLAYLLQLIPTVDYGDMLESVPPEQLFERTRETFLRAVEDDVRAMADVKAPTAERVIRAAHLAAAAFTLATEGAERVLVVWRRECGCPFAVLPTTYITPTITLYTLLDPKTWKVSAPISITVLEELYSYEPITPTTDATDAGESDV